MINETIQYADMMEFGLRDYTFKTTPETPMFQVTNDNLQRSPYEITEDGSVKFFLYFPKAKTVTVKAGLVTCTLNKIGEYWTGIYNVGKGFIPLGVFVDGNSVISKMLPIGIGSNEVINFIEVPENEIQDGFQIKMSGFPHGNVSIDFLESRITGKMERVMIYLPPQYFQYPEERFPTLYLQHGYGENETVWVNHGKMNFIMDELIQEKKATPCIVVMANGMLKRKHHDGIEIIYKRFEEFMTADLIPHIDQKYRTKTDRKYRAMAGLSMGSIQTSRIAFLHQDLFSYVGLFSGFYSDFLSEINEYQDIKYIQTFNKNIKLFFRGIGDEDLFLPQFMIDDALVEKQGIRNTRKIYHGGHEWNVWRRCFKDFIQLIFTD